MHGFSCWTSELSPFSQRFRSLCCKKLTRNYVQVEEFSQFEQHWFGYVWPMLQYCRSFVTYYCCGGGVWLSRVNVCLGPKENRLLITGMHIVADIYCNCCHQVLGWKYVSSIMRMLTCPLFSADFCTKAQGCSNMYMSLVALAFVVMSLNRGQWSEHEVKIWPWHHVDED